MHTENRLNGEAHALARDKLSEIAADIAITPIEIMPETLRHAVPIVEEMVTAGVVERGDATDAVWRAMVASGFAAHKGEDAAQQLLADCINKTRERADPPPRINGDSKRHDRKQASTPREPGPAHWNIEPWPDPVDGGVLIESIVAAVTSYVVLSSHAANTVALWILFAHTLDAFAIAPIGQLERALQR